MPTLDNNLPVGGAGSNVVDAAGTILNVGGISVELPSMPEFAEATDRSVLNAGLNGISGLTLNPLAYGCGELSFSVVAGSLQDAALQNLFDAEKVVDFLISDSNGRRKYVGQCASRSYGPNATDAGLRPYVLNCINVRYVIS